MAVTSWYTGRATETTATVVVRADSTGDVAVVANGQTAQAACNTAVNDGNAVATITGLSAGQTYPYTVGGVAGGTLRTAPANAPFWVALVSCWGMQETDVLALRLLTAPAGNSPSDTLHREMVAGLKAFIGLGDWTYMNVNTTVRGIPLVPIEGGSLANGKDLTKRLNYYRAAATEPGRMALTRNVPTYQIKDDHDFDPDNASYSIQWVIDNYGSGTQTDLDELWAAASGAWTSWTQGNPPRTLAGNDYFTIRLGPVEFYCTDLIMQRDHPAAADGPNKRLMSAEQEERLLADMAASSAPFKVWCTSKQFVSSIGRNADGWYNLPGASSEGYQTQLQRILADIRFPRAGCLAVTGDEHVQSDVWVSDGYFGGAHAAISQMSAGPATIPVINDPNDGPTYRAGVVDKERVWTPPPAGRAMQGENNYVLLRVLHDRVERYVLGSRYGLRYMGYISTADNVVRR